MLESSARVGSTIANFAVEELIGVGGMGAVYLARDPTLKRRVALKVVAPALADDARYRERFLREAELAASLDHPAIVPVYGAGESDGDLYLAMRYVEGGSLADRLLVRGALEPAAATATLAPIAAALDAAHSAGLVHRDVKPANILLDGSHAYLADFGLARATATTSSGPLSAAGIRGTVGYLAPEQLEGRPASALSDQYALACVLFECVTGRKPFERENDLAVVYAHHAEPPPSATSLHAGLPRAVDAVLARGLAKRPEDRFASCEELVAATAAACGVTTAPTARRSRRRVLLAAAAAGAVTVAVAAGVLLVGGGRVVDGVLVSAPPVVSDPLVIIDPSTGSVVGRVSAGSAPSRIAIGGGAAWVINADVQTVTKIDLRTLKAERPFGVGAAPLDVAYGDGSLWVSTTATTPVGQVGDPQTTYADAVVRVDPDTFLPLGRTPLAKPSAGRPYGTGGTLAVSDGIVWVVDADGTVSRIRTAAPGAGTVVTGIKAYTIAVGEGAVWALGEKLWRIEPSTARVTDAIIVSTPEGAGAVAIGDGAAWVASWGDGNIWRVDRGPPLTRHAIPGPAHTSLLAYIEGHLLAIRGDDGDLAVIDPSDGRVVTTSKLGGPAHGVATDGGHVWVTTTAAGSPAAHDVGAVGVAAGACGALERGPDATPTFLVVSDLPLAGPSSRYGSSMADAIRAVLRARGFKAGAYTIGYQSCNHGTPSGATSREQCAGNARAYAEAPSVVGVLGTFDPDCTTQELGVLAAAPDGPLALMSPDGDSADGIASAGKGNYAGLSLTSATYLSALPVIARRLGAHRLFIVSDNPRAFHAQSIVAASRLGVELVGDASWPGQAATDALVHRVVRAKPDAVAFFGVTRSTGPVVRSLRRRLGAAVRMIALEALPVSDLRRYVGPEAIGMYVMSSEAPYDLLTERGRSWLQGFAATQPDGAVTPFAPMAAQATEILLDAIARSDGTRPSVARELLRTRVDDGILQPFSFTVEGVRTPAPVTLLRVEQAQQASGAFQPAFAGAVVEGTVTGIGPSDGLAPRGQGMRIGLSTHIDGPNDPDGLSCQTRAEAANCPASGAFAATDPATTRRLCRSGTYHEISWFPPGAPASSVFTLVCPDGSTLVLETWMVQYMERFGGGSADIVLAWVVTGGTGRLADVAGEGTTRQLFRFSSSTFSVDGQLSGELRAG